MLKDNRSYVPLFPRVYGTLLDVYGNAMTAKMQENAWEKCNMAKNTFLCLIRWKQEGIIPEEVQSNLHIDIDDVMRRTHCSIDIRRLLKPHLMLRNSILDLRLAFGGK